jgi:hypothetical protein
MSKSKVEKTTNSPAADDKVALYSQKNLFWNEVGTLKIGYNIVNSENAEKWLRHKAVRIATPDEVAKAYSQNK